MGLRYELCPLGVKILSLPLHFSKQLSVHHWGLKEIVNIPPSDQKFTPVGDKLFLLQTGLHPGLPDGLFSNQKSQFG
jgi:hypothetical protein